MPDGLISTERGLIAAIREWVGKRNISYGLLDEIAGIAPAHSNRLLGHHLAAKPKRITASTVFFILDALGLGLKLEEDPAQLARVKDAYEPRMGRQVRSRAAAVMAATEARKRAVLKRWSTPRLTELAATTEQVKVDTPRKPRLGTLPDAVGRPGGTTTVTLT